MKKIKRHKFIHRDPEAAVQTEKKEEKMPGKNIQNTEGPEYIKKDFKRTMISIAVFIAIIATVYLIQTKTSIFNPILKLFSL